MKWKIRFITVILLIAFGFAPNAMGQWAQTNGPYGAHVKSLVINDGAILAGTDFHGIYKSTDNGLHWSQANIGLTDTIISFLTKIGSSIFSGNAKGLFFSTDNGTTWNVIDTSGPLKNTYCLTSNGSTLFAGAQGVFKSADSGKTWTITSDGLPMGTYSGYVNSMIFSGKNLLAGEIGGGVYLSTNNGRNWKPINNGMTNYTIHSFAEIGSYLFAGTDSNVYFSTNDGESWDFASDNLPNRANINALTSIGSMLFAATDSSGIYVSSDSGVTWNPINTGLKQTQIFSIATADTSIFASTQTGVSRSDDSGKNWLEISNDLFGDSFSILAGSGKKIYTISDEGGIFQTSDGGNHWIEVKSNIPPGQINGFGASGDNLFLILNPGSRLFLSTNAGSIWSEVDKNILGPVSYEVAVMGNNFLIAADSGIFRSQDDGLTWHKVSAYSTTEAKTFSVNGVNLYAWTDKEVLMSSDSGKNWGIIDTTVKAIGSIDGFGVSEGFIFVMLRVSPYYFGPSLLTSKIGSNQWWETYYPNPGVPTAVVSSGYKGFVSSYEGLYIWVDSLVSWVLVDTTMKYQPSLLIADSLLYAGTSDNGIWKRKISDFTATLDKVNVPKNLLFDDTMVGDTECKIIEVQNTGNIPFTILSLSTSGGLDSTDFYINTSQFPIHILPGDSDKIKICFIPQSIYSFDDQVKWITDISAKFSDGILPYTTFFGTGIQKSGVDAEKNLTTISLSPNPTTGILTIRNAPENLAGISILNVLGQEVIQLDAPHSTDFTIDLSKLPAGTYFARFSAAGEVVTRKIIKE